MSMSAELLKAGMTCKGGRLAHRVGDRECKPTNSYKMLQSGPIVYNLLRFHTPHMGTRDLHSRSRLRMASCTTETCGTPMAIFPDRWS